MLYLNPSQPGSQSLCWIDHRLFLALDDLKHERNAKNPDAYLIALFRVALSSSVFKTLPRTFQEAAYGNPCRK